MDFDTLKPKLVMVLGEQAFQNIVLATQLEETLKKLQEANNTISSQKGGK